MRRFSLIAGVIALALPALTAPARADDAALLMGVSRYEELRRVASGRDVLSGAEAMRAAGYDVATLADGRAADMRALAAALAQEADQAERLVVALSGRFVTDGVRSWYLASDAPPPGPFGLDHALSVETMLAVLARAPGQAVLVLGFEAERQAPFDSYLREGLGTLDIPQGVTVITGAPDRIDQVLTAAIAAPGVNVAGFVRENRRLRLLGYQPRSLVMQPVDGAPQPQPDPPSEPQPPVLADVFAWNVARGADTAEAYRNFIRDYPGSRFASEARARLDAIENDPQRLAEQAETGMNLTRNERREIQRQLTLLGFDTRGVDGIFGPGTRGAIRGWQGQNREAETGYLSPADVSTLALQARDRTAQIAADEAAARAAAEQAERSYWGQTGADGTEAGLRAYLARYPQGLFAAQAQDQLNTIAAARAAASDNQIATARAAEEALDINPVLRRLIESRLSQLGYAPGPVDGRFDATTRRAIARYQTQGGLTSTGYIDQPTLARLLSQTFGR